MKGGGSGSFELGWVVCLKLLGLYALENNAYSTFKGTKPWSSHNVNVDIFACINFSEFMKIGNFACIKIRG